MLDISDHAVLRYLERVKGVSIEAIKAEMRTPVLDHAERFGRRFSSAVMANDWSFRMVSS